MAKVELQTINKDNKDQVLFALEAYKRQNPKKYEAKKAELFARYGLTDEAEETLPETKLRKKEKLPEVTLEADK